MTVADLTPDHFGWLVKVIDNALYPGSHRYFTVIGLRHWTNDDGSQVGVLTDEGKDRGWRGTERMYPAATVCTLERPITAKAKRAAKTASIPVTEATP